jgi:phosphoglycolate phosphatase
VYDLVIFDLDGTLIDSVGDIADALNRTLGTRHDDAAVARWVGSGVRALLERAGVDAAQLDEMRAKFLQHYAEQPCKHTRPYLRVRETLRAMAAEKVVATNKPGNLARTIVDKLGFAGDFVAVLGEDDVGARKPDPLIVDILRGKVGASRAQTLYVGDSLVDAETARNAGVDLCLVTYGYAPTDAIRAAPATYHIDRFDELLPIVSPK